MDEVGEGGGSCSHFFPPLLHPPSPSPFPIRKGGGVGLGERKRPRQNKNEDSPIDRRYNGCHFWRGFPPPSFLPPVAATPA